MPKATDQFEEFYAPDRATWRQWLAANHDTSPGVWLVYYKKESGKPRVSYDEAVEEALCYGWIDSVPNKIDDLRYKQLFSPRKPKSTWSKLNKQRVEKLIEQGQMTEYGLAKIEIARQNGTWTILDEVEALIVPADLQAALDANEPAATNWAAFSNSVKKGILGWLNSARRPETRAKRIADTVAKAAQNLRINFDR